RAEPSEQERAELKKVQAEAGKLRAEDKRLQREVTDLEPKAKADPRGAAAASLKERRAQREAVAVKLRGHDQRQRTLSHAETEACVDSELMLLWWDTYPLYRWQLNTLYFQVPEKVRKGRPHMLMTCRLDGPSVELVKRLVDQAIAVEKKGLVGKVYVDARGIKYNPKAEPDGFGYGGYDESLREMA